MKENYDSLLRDSSTLMFKTADLLDQIVKEDKKKQAHLINKAAFARDNLRITAQGNVKFLRARHRKETQ